MAATTVRRRRRNTENDKSNGAETPTVSTETLKPKPDPRAVDSSDLPSESELEAEQDASEPQAAAQAPESEQEPQAAQPPRRRRPGRPRGSRSKAKQGGVADKDLAELAALGRLLLGAQQLGISVAAYVESVEADIAIYRKKFPQ